MPLPTRFDPATGRFVGVSSPSIAPSHNSTYGSQFSFDNRNRSTSSTSTSTRRRSRNPWTWLNDCIKSIGNWIDDMIEPVSGWVALLAMIAGVIGLAIWAFSGGNILSIILRLVGAVIIGYILMIGLGIALWLLSLVMKGFRFIFWNIYTLLIAIAVCFMIYAYHHGAFDNIKSHYEQVECEEIPYETYRVTARVLNVRSTPSPSGRVLGTLKRNEQIDVSDIENGFAKIYFNGNDGYISTDYIEKVTY